MEAVVGEERGEGGRRVLGVFVKKLRQWKEAGPSRFAERRSKSADTARASNLAAPSGRPSGDGKL